MTLAEKVLVSVIKEFVELSQGSEFDDATSLKVFHSLADSAEDTLTTMGAYDE